MSREALLARTLVELADTLVDDFDVVELLTRLADRCVDVLDVAAAGLMLVAPDGDLRVMASSSEAMRLLELFELQAHEGPCLDCYRTGQPVVNQDLATVNGRWPRFAAEALAAGFHSVHALPLRLRGTVIGALNLFHIEPGEMRPADVDAAQALADVATIAILQHRATLEGATRERTAPRRAQQPHRHRAGQRHGGRAVGRQHGTGVLHAAQPRPQPQPSLVDVAHDIINGTPGPPHLIPPPAQAQLQERRDLIAATTTLRERARRSH